ncbi:SURF1 family protein [Aquincola sp. S2]|uniref:SURF1-like protein n=1 Tax=Pseudaquabacterium terrae TaxID=2732868 RepID=A0ABX2EDT3_9BURK|nr:SURF1 family protein [Aquabacterium terrae]NRF66772.1 SURF1 family protein [Aquabacterium terrae]
MTAAWREQAIVFVAAVAACAGTARLGLWQLDRAAQKKAIAEAIRTRGALPPLPQAELARDAATAAAQHHRPVLLRGRWLAQHTIALDNRQMDGRPGFFMLTPLELAPGDVVLVQRGWLPRDFQERTRLPAVPTPEGEVRVLGRIAAPPSALFALGEGERGPIRQNLVLDDFSRETRLAFRPLSVQQLDEPSAPPEPLQRRWSQPVLDTGKHHGYAFQWFALSALIAGLYVWLQIIRPRRARR